METATSWKKGLTIFYESQGAFKFAEIEGINWSTKHSDVTYHFVCNAASRSEARLEHQTTPKNNAYGLTERLLKRCPRKPSNWPGSKANEGVVQIDQRRFQMKHD